MIAHTPAPVHSPVQPARVVTWLRCHACQRVYFAVGAPTPQPCPACAGGRHMPTSVWDLAHEAAPPGVRLMADYDPDPLALDAPFAVFLACDECCLPAFLCCHSVHP